MNTYTESPGLILSSLNFQDFDRIISVFTQKEGIIKLLVKGANRPKSLRTGFCLPLTLANFYFRKAKGELYHFKEAKLINAYFPIRNNLDALKTAGEIIQHIKSTQMPSEPSPALFSLVVAYLKQIALFTCPLPLLMSSFKIKLLKYDGLFSISTECSRCKQPLREIAFHRGEVYCAHHNPKQIIAFLSKEWELLRILFNFRNFREISNLKVSDDLLKKINQLITQLQIDL